MNGSPILFAYQEKTEPPAGAEAQKPDAPWWTNFFPFILLIVMFYFLFIVPGRRDRQQRQQLLSALKKNDEVVTSAGIIGVVANIKDNADEVTLKIDDNARIRVLRSSIVRIVNAKEPAKEEGIQKAP